MARLHATALIDTNRLLPLGFVGGKYTSVPPFVRLLSKHEGRLDWTAQIILSRLRSANNECFNPTAELKLYQLEDTVTANDFGITAGSLQVYMFVIDSFFLFPDLKTQHTTQKCSIFRCEIFV